MLTISCVGFSKGINQLTSQHFGQCRSFPVQCYNCSNNFSYEYAQASRLQQELLAYFARVGLFAVQWQEEVPEEQTMSVGREPITPEIEVCLAQVGRLAHNAPQQMQFTGFHKVIEWLQFVQAASEDVPASWVTWYELMWSFQRYTGICELRKVDCHSKWAVQSERQEYDFVKSCRSFAAFMTLLICTVRPEFQSKVVKPTNYRWQMWGCCLAFKWNPTDKQNILDWILAEAGYRQFHKAQADLGTTPSLCVLPVTGHS